MRNIKRWRVETQPVPENPTPEGKNESGILIKLTDGSQTVEVSRVLFVRRNAKNKSVGFKRQLLKEFEKALEAAEVLNDSYLTTAEKDHDREAAMQDAEHRRNKFLNKLQDKGTPRV